MAAAALGWCGAVAYPVVGSAGPEYLGMAVTIGNCRRQRGCKVGVWRPRQDMLMSMADRGMQGDARRVRWRGLPSEKGSLEGHGVELR